MPLPPQMISVASSNIAAIGMAYFSSGLDPNPPPGIAGHLYVAFKSGKTYVYNNFPGLLFEDFKAASSKGKFHYHYIRGSYRYSQKY